MRSFGDDPLRVSHLLQGIDDEPKRREHHHRKREPEPSMEYDIGRSVHRLGPRLPPPLGPRLLPPAGPSLDRGTFLAFGFALFM